MTNPPNSSRYSDDILWQALRNGDRTAFDAIFQQYVYLLYHYGHKITPHKGIVEDCVQDLFVELWEKRMRLGDTSSVKYYLFACLRRRIIRCMARENRYATSVPENLSFELSPESRMIKQQLAHEQREKLRLALCALSKRQKEAVYLKFFSQLSYEEIAHTMGLNKRSVYNLISHAIDNLQEQFSDAPRTVSLTDLLPPLAGTLLFFLT